MWDDTFLAPGPVNRVGVWAQRHPSIVDALLALTAFLLLGPSSISLVAAAPLNTGWMLLLGLALVALHVPLATRRSFPIISYGAACLGMLLLTLAPYLTDDGLSGPAVPGPLLPSALLFFVLLYSLSEQSSARRALAGLALALLGGVFVLVRFATGTPPWSQIAGQSGNSAWVILVVVIVAGAAGAYSLGRLRQTRLAYLSELRDKARRTEAERVAEAAQAAETERRRIAREMHDVVSHSLAVVISQAEGGRMLSAQRDPQSAAVFATIADTGRAAMSDMRAMLGVLRDRGDVPPSERAPQPGLADLPALLTQVRSTGCEMVWRELGDAAPLSSSTGLAVFRLVQESLTNVVKHGGDARAAEVTLTWSSGQLRIEITNQIPATTPASGGGGSGLVGMRERVEAVGGTWHAGAEHGTWRVLADLPIRHSPPRRLSS